MLSKLVVAWLSAVQAARMAKRDASTIAGVRVHKYRADAQDFIVLFNTGTTSGEISEICAGRCSSHGNPDLGGAAWAAVHGRNALEEMVSGHQEQIQLLEVDSTDYLIPDFEVPGISAAASWGLNSIGISGRKSTGRGVHVYIQDTGVRVTHTDFGGRARSAIDMSSGTLVVCSGSTTCAADNNGHGTHCAGTATGRSFGVAPGASVYGVKTLNPTGSRSWQMAAIDWVSTRGRRPAVLSMSLGGSGADPTYTVVIGAATAAGITVVVAAGNSNADSCNFSPAFAADAITVGATTSLNSRASYSNFGRCNNIMAPGSSIVSASSGSDSGSATMSGTSMACPHVSGAVALLLEGSPSLNRSQVMQRLTGNARRGLITGLKANDPDLFLNVRGF